MFWPKGELYKNQSMWIGSSRSNTETPLALKWCKTVKALGVHFSYNNEESLQKNFYAELKKNQISNTLVGLEKPLIVW